MLDSDGISDCISNSEILELNIACASKSQNSYARLVKKFLKLNRSGKKAKHENTTGCAKNLGCFSLSKLCR